MASEAGLLAACVAAPHDDAPRLVWADVCGGERGELVVVQCDLARGDLAPADAAARRAREGELIAAHGAAWNGLAGIPARCRFRRGFVDAIAIGAHDLLAHADAVFAAAPLLESIEVDFGHDVDNPFDNTPSDEDLDTTTTAARALEVLALPGLRRLEGLSLVETRTYGGGLSNTRSLFFGDAIIGAIPRGLRALRIAGTGITEGGFGKMLEARLFADVERLEIENAVSVDTLRAIFAQTSKLHALDMAYYRDLRTLIPLLPLSLAELRLGSVDDATLALLASRALAPSLRRLAIARSALDESIAELASFRALRALDLRGTYIGSRPKKTTERATLALAATPFPTLRELGVPIAEPAIVEALGPRLEVLATKPERTFFGADRTGSWIARKNVI